MKKVLLQDYAKSLGVSSQVVAGMARAGKLKIDRVSKRTAFVIIPDEEIADKTTKLGKLNEELEELKVQLAIKETKAKLDGIIDQEFVDQVNAEHQKQLVDRGQLEVVREQLQSKENMLATQNRVLQKKEADWKSKYEAVQHDITVLRKYYQQVLKQHPGLQALVEPELKIEAKWWSGK